MKKIVFNVKYLGKQGYHIRAEDYAAIPIEFYHKYDSMDRIQDMTLYFLNDYNERKGFKPNTKRDIKLIVL